MGRKCSVGGCRSNYKGEKSATVYAFPYKDRNELKRWLSVLPNVIDPDKITRYMGICSNHWNPADPMVSVNGKLRPVNPPHIFTTPKSFQRQTVPSTSRDTADRLSFTKRAAQPDQLEQFNEDDKIISFSVMVDKIYEFVKPLPIKFYPLIETDHDGIPTCLHLVTFTDMTSFKRDCSVSIDSTMKVNCFHSNTPVSARDLLGYQCKLERWSQLENILVRVRNSRIDPASEVKEAVRSLRNHQGDEDDETMPFLLEQLELKVTRKNGRRYSAATMNIAMSLFLNSKACYQILRQYLSLPSVNTLTSNVGNFNTVGTDKEAENFSNLFFSNCNVNSNKCLLVFDEIYVKPSLRFRGGHVLGYATDEPKELARTVLTFMVRLMFGSKKVSSFVLKFVPVFTLKAPFLRNQVENVIKLVEKAGGEVVALMSDNHSANRSVYTMLRTDVDLKYKTSHPCDPSRYLYLLHDPVHLVKCIRNNWITEPNQELTLKLPDDRGQITGRWCDIATLYDSEKDHPVRRTTLTHCAVDPSSIEKVKVAPVLQVFNDKTVAALAQDGKEETAGLIFHILRAWKILNNKSTTAHIHLNDADRRPITADDDSLIQYLAYFSAAVKEMTCGRGRRRCRSLTKETSDSLSQTLDGLIDLCKQLLQTNVQFVLLGHFQSDCIEGEFGIYRQAFGGLYYITLEQVLIAAKGRRVELINNLELEAESGHRSDCCSDTTISLEEYEFIDNLKRHAVENVSDNERTTLFYIAGFITKKERIIVTSDEIAEIGELEEAEFTRLLSRGKLAYPSMDLFHFCLLSYTFFLKHPKPCCRQLIHVFQTIHSAYCSYSLGNSARRLANTLLNGLVKTVNNQQKVSDDIRKKNKLSSA